MKLTTDSDWPDDAGSVLKVGVHWVQHWCGRQPVITLSSGEAELQLSLWSGPHAWIGKCAARDTRTQLAMSLVYASACKSMLLRHGSGGLTHVETKNLWVQEAMQSNHIKVTKMNAADLVDMLLFCQHTAGSHETHQLQSD